MEARSVRLIEKIDRLRAQMAMLKVMEAEVEASPDGQVSLTDPDARAMATSGRGSGIVGYNVQSAVEGEHHPFGTIKAWMGHTHFLMKRLPNVKTEISLHILAYNMKRVMAVLGTKPLMEAIRA